MQKVGLIAVAAVLVGGSALAQQHVFAERIWTSGPILAVIDGRRNGSEP